MSIRFIDQDDKDIPLVIKQNGEAPSWVKPNRRTRFNIRFDIIALRMVQLEIDKHPEHWFVNDIAIHGKSQIEKPWQGKADAPELDGIPGDAFRDGMKIGDPGFATAQTAMTITFDVTYVGPNPEGQPFSLVVHCRAAR